jgi:hypothetical protein
MGRCTYKLNISSNKLGTISSLVLSQKPNHKKKTKSRTKAVIINWKWFFHQQQHKTYLATIKTKSAKVWRPKLKKKHSKTHTLNTQGM